MSVQEILIGDFKNNFIKCISNISFNKIFLVCGKFFEESSLCNWLYSTGFSYVLFDKFTSNPSYESVIDGVKLFKNSSCDIIVAIGGGSALDVAKCVKLYSKMPLTSNFLKQDLLDTGVPMIAVPTTAGTGSESTRFSVIYFNGEKQSVHHESIIPSYAILDSNFLLTLPKYQKECTLLDALCQAIESWWSVNSTEESIGYSKKAIFKILNNYEKYIFYNDCAAAMEIMIAANYAGRAINITQTTAPHAMSYKITTLYNIPHGHAVALSIVPVWEYMISNMDDESICLDHRGMAYLRSTFNDISNSFGVSTPILAVEKLKNILISFEINRPCAKDKDDYLYLARSVNLDRLKNNPIALNTTALEGLYKSIILAEGRC